MMKKILFVCLGNICRSPMAEYILRDMAQKRGIAVNVASAGTSGWHDGEYMHCGTAEILDGLSIESRDFRSRKMPVDALQYYDYVIVMDDSNLRDVQAALGRCMICPIDEPNPQTNETARKPHDHFAKTYQCHVATH